MNYLFNFLGFTWEQLSQMRPGQGQGRQQQERVVTLSSLALLEVMWRAAVQNGDSPVRPQEAAHKPTHSLRVSKPISPTKDLQN